MLNIPISFSLEIIEQVFRHDTTSPESLVDCNANTQARLKPLLPRQGLRETEHAFAGPIDHKGIAVPAPHFPAHLFPVVAELGVAHIRDFTSVS
jgi:hypothetical protein